MKIALFGKSFADDRFVFFRQLVGKLMESDISIMVYEPFFRFISSKDDFLQSPELFSDHHQLPGNADFLFSIGGDGTMLDAITLIRESGIPIMGINLGRMGFLSSISKNEINQAIDSIRNNDFTLDQRSLLSLETPGQIFGELNYALNEFTINKKESGSMILVHVYVGDQLLNSYWADGLIIATPTGSTAYSLSCNGPILVPGAENFVITPIAPHNLTVRPVVIPDKSVIKIEVDGRLSPYHAGLDSRSAVIESSAEIVIRKASFFVNIVQRRSDNFFNTIRQKLLWGHDIRN